nr:acyl-CoA synthetase short-chain family member 3, mitochondrial-like [Lytechinus pictus]
MLYVAGEIFDRESLHWCRDVFNVPIIDHWWQTETGWAMTHTAVGLGEDLYPRHGVTGKPVPGWDVRVLDETGQEAPRGELGNICIKLPLPPAAFTTLWGSHERYIKTYFEKYPGYYDTMDAGVHSEDGYIAIQARVDDVISVAGHRIAASAIEEADLHTRHNSVLGYLAKELKSCAESSGIRLDLYADLPGMRINGGTIPSNVIVTTEKPDITLCFPESTPPKIVLIELTVPFEPNIRKARERKEAMVEQGDIVECCTIPVNDKLKGQVPVGLCVLKKSK